MAPPRGRLKYGDPLGPGNPYGNPVVHWPNFSPQYPVPAAPGVIPPSSPFVSIAPNTGRLPRTFQWSIGFQREITQQPGGGCRLRGQSRRLVGGAPAGRPELQRAYAAAVAIAVRTRRAPTERTRRSSIHKSIRPRSSPGSRTWPIRITFTRDSRTRKPCCRRCGRIRSGTAFRRSWVLQMGTPGTTRSRSR